jgi:hypothetical protein
MVTTLPSVNSTPRNTGFGSVNKKIMSTGKKCVWERTEACSRPVQFKKEKDNGRRNDSHHWGEKVQRNTSRKMWKCKIKKMKHFVSRTRAKSRSHNVLITRRPEREEGGE